MKRLLGFIVALLMLGAVVPGCGGAHRYDGRLTAVDSLMRNHPDSALAMLEALPTDSLATEHDRAYRDLLLTQARYKAYIPATTDSDINRALAYYKRHPKEQEKLTRAYIYKGAVLEELSYPDSAMFYYKQAEAAASPNDYVNLGQLYTRTANLYRVFYGNEQECFEKYQLAYKYHTLSGNKKMQLNSLYNMIMMNGITRQEKQDEYMNQAMKLAEELDDQKKLFEILELRCRQLSRDESTRQEAKLIALDCLSKRSQYINNDLLLDLAYLYTLENKLDSAELFLNVVHEDPNTSENNHIKVRKHEILLLRTMHRDNLTDGDLHLIQSCRLSDSIMNNTKKYSIEKIESKFNRTLIDDYMSKVSSNNWILKLMLTVFLIVIITFLTLYLIQVNKTQSIVQGLKKAVVDEHTDMIFQLDKRNSVIEQMLTKLVAFMKLHSGTKNQFSTFDMTHSIKETFGEIIDDVFWDELTLYLNKHNNNIIAEIADYPRIKKKDLRFIELLCCGFSDLEIAIIMNYSTKYVWNKKKNLAQKLGINIPIQDYLNRSLTTTTQ